MKTTILAIMAIISTCGIAGASDSDLGTRQAKAAEFERQADWKLHFANWDDLAVYSAPVTNGPVVTTHMIPVKNITEAIRRAPSRKDLAVVIISHRFHSHFDKQTGKKQINQLSETIKKSGFEQVVLLSETSVGNLTIEE
jgi:hypothetical protein